MVTDVTVVSREENLALLARLVQQRVPDYMVPSMFLDLSELPLTPNGKVDQESDLPARAAVLSDGELDALLRETLANGGQL